MLNIIISWCKKFWNQVLDICRWVFETIYDLLEGVFYIILDVFFTIVETIITAINFAEITALSSLQTWTGLPTQIIWLLNYLNIPTCLAIVIAAYGIRLLLNLIPAALTRV